MSQECKQQIVVSSAFAGCAGAQQAGLCGEHQLLPTLERSWGCLCLQSMCWPFLLKPEIRGSHSISHLPLRHVLLSVCPKRLPSLPGASWPFHHSSRKSQGVLGSPCMESNLKFMSWAQGLEVVWCLFFFPPPPDGERLRTRACSDRTKGSGFMKAGLD